MKNIFIIILTILSLPVFAATQSDLILKGSVAPILEISIAHKPVASNLDLSKAGSSLLVATITEKSNYATGYKVQLRSLNAGKLVNTIDPNSFVKYTLRYHNTNFTNATTSLVNVYQTASLRGTFTKNLKVSFSKPVGLSAGSYEDTVQFIIQSN